MLKRPAVLSPVEELPEAKKPRLELSQTDSTQQEARKEPVADNDAPGTEISTLGGSLSWYAYTIMEESKLSHTGPSGTENTGDDEQEAAKHKSKASEGFRAWKPAVADMKIPACEPHWGIIPRPGCDWPAVKQPPACTSNGAIEPPLWEDRKGGIRVKRGDRFIKGYDQAYHLWLPLMNLRPRLGDQQPKRDPIAYQCHHGIPVDWSDSKALTVINKGLQNAIRDNSNKEGPYTAKERETLATIFREQPLISLLEAAMIFNARAHPLKDGVNEKGVYPIGRFTESIQHEYRVYKSSYNKGQAPVVNVKDVSETKKDIVLEDLYIEWTKEVKEAKKAAKKAEKAAAKTEKKATEAGESNPRRKKSDSAKRASGKMSETAGVTKTKRKGKNWKDITDEEKAAMAARADATGRAINGDAESEAAVNTAVEAVPVGSGSTGSEPVDTAVSKTNQPRLLVELVTVSSTNSPRDVQSPSPPSPSVPCVATMPSHEIETHTVGIGPQVQAKKAVEEQADCTYSSSSVVTPQLVSGTVSTIHSDSLVELTVVETETAIETEFIRATQSDTTSVSGDSIEESHAVSGLITAKAARDVEVDENYDDDEYL